MGQTDDEGKRGLRPSWTVFFGQMAIEMRMPADALMRDLSLVSLVGSIRASAAAKKSAYDEAKRRSEAGETVEL